MNNDDSQYIPVDLIVATGRLRKVNPLKIEGFKNDFDKRGLKAPLTVSKKRKNGTYKLVCGGHRLEVIKQLGWETVPVFFHTGSSDEQDMDEALENLTRSELTMLDRALHVAQVKRVWQRQHPNIKHGGIRKGDDYQESTVDSWTEAIVGQTGWSGGTLARSAKIGKKITPKAADLLFGTDVSNNQRELLALVDYSPEFQRDIALKISSGEVKTVAAGAATLKQRTEPEEAPNAAAREVSRISNLWGKIGDDAKRAFVEVLRKEGFI